jgi:hypothetical protein
MRMHRYLASGLLAILAATAVVAAVTPYPANFHGQLMATNGTSLYVRVGGHGPAVVLLHGFLGPFDQTA